jgi:hypothetical protein
MRKSVILGVCAIVALTAADADAQWTTPLEGRLTVSLNGGGQAGSTDIDRTITFSLYEEDARIDSRQTVSAGGVFDLGFVYRVGPNWGIGLGYTTASGSADAIVEGALPHPIFFAQPRVFSAGVPNLDTRERAVHLQAVLFVPFVENVDFTFAAGPSFFRAEQAFSRTVSFAEVPPTFNTVDITDIEVVSLSESATGFHISGDVTYSFLPNVGAAFMLRYARATVDMTLGDGTTVELRPGGFQVLFGARLRF